MTTGQRRALKEAGIATRRGFAGLAGLPRLAGRDSLMRAQAQARLQVASEDEGIIRYRLLEPERDASRALVPNRGLLALPEPVTGDLFFDIEGARYYSEDSREFGLQYLFGVVDTADVDSSGRPRYTAFWAFDRQGEKRAFEELVDFITKRRAVRPGLHVYHYNHYEPTSVDHLTELHGTRQEAVGALTGRFATREDEVDDLFRLGVFVDLYRVIRQGVQAGVESYSIKRLEPLCGYRRQVDLRAATASLIAFEAALEDGTAARSPACSAVAGYNEDDCRATLALRDWLEDRRAELAGRLGEDLPRPVFAEQPGAPEDPETARIRAALLAGVSAETSDAIARDVSAETSEARRLLADLLDWHRREDKPAWWRYFQVRTLSPAELTGEPDALGGLTGGDVVDHVNRSVVRRFSFPPQEHRFSCGQTAYDVETGRGWSVWAVDDATGTIELKIGNTYDGPLPSGLVEAGPIGTRELRERLRELGDRVVRDGLGGTDAATALLLRRPPEAGDPEGPGPAGRDGRRGRGPARDLAAAVVPAVAGAAGDREDLHRGRAGPRAGRAGPHGGPHRAVARGHPSPDRHRVRARGPAGTDRADRAAGGAGQPIPARCGQRDAGRAAGAGAARRRTGRGRGHRLAVGPARPGGQRGHPVRGRGGAAVAGQRAGGGRRGREPGAARRPAAAGPAQPGHPPAGSGGLGTGAHPGRPGDDARGRRAAARPDLPDAPGPVPVHLRGVLRREAARRRRARPAGDPGRRAVLRVGAAGRRGAARGQHQRVTGRGRRGGAAGGAARGPFVAGPGRRGAAGRRGRHLDRDPVQRADPGHPGGAGGPRPDRVPGRDRRQVPGPRGPGGDLLDGHLVGGRGAARPGVPLRPAPAERGDLTGQGAGHHRGQPRPGPGVLPDPVPDDPGQRPVPGVGAGSAARCSSRPSAAPRRG